MTLRQHIQKLKAKVRQNRILERLHDSEGNTLRIGRLCVVCIEEDLFLNITNHIERFENLQLHNLPDGTESNSFTPSTLPVREQFQTFFELVTACQNQEGWENILDALFSRSEEMILLLDEEQQLLFDTILHFCNADIFTHHNEVAS